MAERNGPGWWAAIALGLALGALPAQAGGVPVSGGGTDLEGSVVAMRPLGAGHYTLHAQFGWPGLMLEALHGVSPRVDVGVAAWLHTFSFEGRTQFVQQGVKLTFRARFLLADLGPATLGLDLSPGVFSYAAGPSGVTLPAALVVGIRASDWLHVGVGGEVPALLSLVSGAWYLRFLGSVGAECFLGPHVSTTLRVRAGPLYNTSTGGRAFSLDAMAGLALRL